jgi:tripartite-type tricarboxylate transporter receptor subunit TctC
MKRLFSTTAAIAAAVVALGAQAQGYPSRPVKIVVPFAPGGFTDVVARILQTQLSGALGQPIVIENKPGAGSTIGTAEVANAKPDGYTLAMVSTTHVITPSIYKKMPYDALKDFTPVMKLAEGPYVLVVHPSLPARTVKELVDLAKAEPGKIDYASSGNGSSQHLVGALFGQMAGVNLNHVPYKGSGQAMQDLVGGQVKVSFVGAPNAVPYLNAGKLRALGVTTKKRSADLPEIPSIDEAGVPGYDATLWLGLLAPPGTPADIVAKVRDGVTRALSSPDAKKLVNSAGVDVALSTPEEFAALMKSELERWGKVVRETGATVN